MQRGFAAELQRVAIVGLVCVLFGLLNGYLAWTLIAGGSLYCGWMLWQIRLLDSWLIRNRRNPQPPPDASGIWGDIFDNIYRLQRRHNKERRRLQQVITRMQETTSAFTDGVVVVDARGNIDWWNNTAEQLLGFQSTDQGHPLVNYVRHPQFIRYFESGNYSDPLDLPSIRNEAKTLQFQINRFGQGERLIVVRDVTRLYKLEEMRKDFVANVSHELRTPLTVIRGYLETLSDSGNLPPVWQKALGQMQQQSERMTALINDLIMLSKLETDDPDQDKSTVKINPLLQTIKSDALAFSADKKHKVTLTCDNNISLYGNEKELRSAFSNLVFNAVKYSPEKTEIAIHFWSDGQGAYFSVTDQGPGIDPIHIPRLTERFYRVDSSRSINSGGTGLGLAIVKHVLLRHNGNLHIESQLGTGSSFTCHFPQSQIIGDTHNLPKPRHVKSSQAQLH